MRYSNLSIFCLSCFLLGHGLAVAAEPNFRFADAGDEAGLFPALTNIAGHGAGWGDIDGDGWADLYVGTFGGKSYDSKPNQLFRNQNGKFLLESQPAVQIPARTTGVAFGDLDNDGDLDLYVGSMPIRADSKAAERQGVLAGCSLFRNDGGGKFTDVSAENGACPPAFGGRSVALLDYDGDSLLDLLVGEDPIPGYNGSPTASARLFRNLGNLKFEDASRAVGLPEGIPGLGVAAADVNNDGWPDFFLANGGNGNRLFLNDKQGKFVEAAGSHDVFAWLNAKGDDMCCGVAIGDLNRDGLLDVVLGQHFSQPWKQEVPNRIYLNRGLTAGVPKFEEVTDKTGFIPLPMKSPHVEIQDFDNDGWPDIYFSTVKFGPKGEPHPFIFKHTGLKNGLPQFGCDVHAVNDFPSAEELAIKGTGPFFDKMIENHRIVYMAPGPTADYNRDGKLDMLLPNWWVAGRSLLLKNETPGGHWLDVNVKGSGKLNTQGIGSRVNVYPAGKLGDASALLGCREIAVGFGYASGQEAIAHFGLGAAEAVDIEVTLPQGLGKIEQKNVKADQRVTLSKP
ncbi:MAG: CRTAC1 family protein [Pirellulaceae bacterium]|nr:CRTAC1 family protein [Pirellulaceae bacterium]